VRAQARQNSGVTSLLEDIAASAERIGKALSSSGYRADFSPASLWEIDRFFDEQTKRGKPRRGGLLAKDLGQKMFALGSYTGEVVRRTLGGEWSIDEDDPQAEINAELRLADGGIIWPVQRVMKRFANGVEDGIAAYGLALGLDVGEAQPRR
jgi:hypothetical protein